MAHHQKRSLAVAFMGALAGLVGTYAAYLLLGAFTGVVAMCASAPEWWMHLYFPLAFVVIPAGAAWVAIAWRRSYLKRHEASGAQPAAAADSLALAAEPPTVRRHWPMITRRAVVSVLVGCAFCLGLLVFAWTVNQNAALGLVPGSRLIIAMNHNVVTLPQWLNVLLLIVLNGLLWGGIVFAVWTRLSAKGAKQGAA